MKKRENRSRTAAARKRVSALLPALCCLLLCAALAACGTDPKTDRADPGATPTTAGAENGRDAVRWDDMTVITGKTGEGTTGPGSTEENEDETVKKLKLTVNGEAVDVEWEENKAVEALREAAKSGPLTVNTERYGGFEQVGPLGRRLPTDDKRTTTAPGDIVLYSGDRMVLFFGSNTWEYTRLGKITGRTPAELTALLDREQATVTVTLE